MDDSYSLTEDALKELKRAQKTLDQVEKKISSYKQHQQSRKLLSKHHQSLTSNKSQGVGSFKPNKSSSGLKNNFNYQIPQAYRQSSRDHPLTKNSTYAFQDQPARNSKSQYDFYQHTQELIRQNNAKLNSVYQGQTQAFVSNSNMVRADQEFPYSNISKIERIYQEKSERLDNKIVQLQQLLRKVNNDKKLLSLENRQLQFKISQLRQGGSHYRQKSKKIQHSFKQNQRNLANLNQDQSRNNIKADLLKQQVKYLESQLERINKANQKLRIKNKKIEQTLREGIRNYRDILNNEITLPKSKSKSLLSKRCPYH